MKDSVLKIERAGKIAVAFPLRSNRGVDQSITPYVLGNPAIDTADGGVRDGTIHRTRKYQTNISCDDFWSPAFSGLWPGEVVTIHHAKFITQTLDALATAGTLIRDLADDGEIYGVKTDGTLIEPTSLVGRNFVFPQQVAAVMFQSKMAMRITGWDDSGNEWARLSKWSASAVETIGA